MKLRKYSHIKRPTVSQREHFDPHAYYIRWTGPTVWSFEIQYNEPFTFQPSLIFREKGDILLEKRKENVLNPMYKIEMAISKVVSMNI